MNIHRFQTLCRSKYLHKGQQLRFLHQAKTETEVDFLPKQEAKISLIESGIKVASVEDNSPVTQVAVVVKAGSRYETPNNLGVSHRLRNAATLTTKNHSGFSLIRNLEVRGAKLSVTGSKDHLFYTLKCPRDEIDSGLEILSDVTNKQVFKPWELEDSTLSLEIDLALLNDNPCAVLNELLHRAAYRGGLSNSLYTPTWMLKKHTTEMLHEYVDDCFTTSRTSVVALGISHDHLQSRVNELFTLNEKTSSNSGASKFASGEIRQEADMKQVHTAIVAEGSGINNNKEALSLAVLEQILGSASELAPKFTKLGAAAAKCTSEPYHVSSLNINYADTGLFGVYITGSPEHMNDLIKTVVNEMKQVAKSISPEAVEIAKYKLKAKLMIDRDISSNTLMSMAIETSEHGQIKDVKDIAKAIDDLKASDIQTVAARVMKAKPAMAALGRLHATPHVDELI